MKQSSQKTGVILKVCIDFMSVKIIQMCSHPINPSHCRYRSKLITAEVMTFHLVRLEGRVSQLTLILKLQHHWP